MISRNQLLWIPAMAGAIWALTGCDDKQKALQSRPADPQKPVRNVDRSGQEQKVVQSRGVHLQKPVENVDHRDDEQEPGQPPEDSITLLVPVDRRIEDSRTVVIRVVEHVRIDEKLWNYEAWKDFQGVFKCIVADPLESGLVKGQDLNVVAAKRSAKSKGMFVHDGAGIQLRAGGQYKVVVSAGLPKGWDAIEPELSVQAFGLAALEAILERTEGGDPSP